MQINADEIPEAIDRLVKIAAGESWDKVGFADGALYGSVHDIRSYYEELACELAEGPITPWSTEEWFYDQTKAGQVILQARRVMKAAMLIPRYGLVSLRRVENRRKRRQRCSQALLNSIVGHPLH